MKINGLKIFIFFLAFLAIMDYISNKNLLEMNRIKISSKNKKDFAFDKNNKPTNGYNHYKHFFYNEAGVYGNDKDYAYYNPQSVNNECPKGYDRPRPPKHEFDFLECYVYFRNDSKETYPIWTGDFETSYCCLKSNKVWKIKTCETDNSYVATDKDKYTCPKVVNKSTGQFHFFPCYKVLDNQCCIKNDCNQEKLAKSDWAFGISYTYKKLEGRKFRYTAGVNERSPTNFFENFKGSIMGTPSKTPQPKVKAKAERKEYDKTALIYPPSPA